MELNNIICVRKDKTIYRDGDKCIKVFEKNYSKASVLNEALNQARIEETGLNIPKIHEVSVMDGKWLIVSDFIEGKTLAELMAENPDKFDEYMDLFVNIQMDILSKTSSLLTNIRHKMSRKVEESGLDATTRYELQTRISGMKKHRKVCHGDFNPSNVIITESGEPYIIDWAHVTQGNGCADAARTYLVFCLNSKQDIAEKYLECYCRKTDTARQLVQRWFPIVAASRLVKRVPEEREFLLNWTHIGEF